jgi:hypothetical protein
MRLRLCYRLAYWFGKRAGLQIAEAVKDDKPAPKPTRRKRTTTARSALQKKSKRAGKAK